MKSAPTIELDVVPSQRVAALSLMIVMLAVIAALISALPVAIRVALALVALLGGTFAIKRFLHPGYKRVACDSSGWQLVSDGGDTVAAMLLGHKRLGPFLVLEFSLDGERRFRCLLTPDVIDAEVRRRLLLILATEPGQRR